MMKRTILLYAVVSAALIVAVRHFELSLFTGQVSLRLYVTVIGLLFLGLGVYAGTRFRRRVVEKEIVVEYVPRVQPAEEPGIAANDLLSPREGEVLLHIAEGLTNREIARRLFVSENTIKTHINNIYSKLGVQRRTQALSKARQLNIIT